MGPARGAWNLGHSVVVLKGAMEVWLGSEHDKGKDKHASGRNVLLSPR